MKLRHELAWFCVGGVLGFLVDAGIVQALVRAFGWNPYLARILSFFCAASVTWLFNRALTFAHRRGASRAAEWGRWLLVMTLGALVNYGVYALTLLLWPPARQLPVVGVALGSAFAAGLNFAGARAWVFKGAEADR